MYPFHLAICVRDIEEARGFYGGLLGCAEGRSAAHWVDFDLYGHQLVCHLDTRLGSEGSVSRLENPVDGDAVPVPHFGVVLDMISWKRLAETLSAGGMNFIIDPHIRFQGQPGEQATMFFLDPSGNALEFKAFQNVAEQLFATQPLTGGASNITDLQAGGQCESNAAESACRSDPDGSAADLQ